MLWLLHGITIGIGDLYTAHPRGLKTKLLMTPEVCGYVQMEVNVEGWGRAWDPNLA